MLPPVTSTLAPMRLAEAMRDVPVVVMAVSNSPGNASSVLPRPRTSCWPPAPWASDRC